MATVHNQPLAGTAHGGWGAWGEYKKAAGRWLRRFCGKDVRLWARLAGRILGVQGDGIDSGQLFLAEGEILKRGDVLLDLGDP